MSILGRRFNDTNAHQSAHESSIQHETPAEQKNSYMAPLSPPHKDVENDIPVATPVDTNTGKSSHTNYGTHAPTVPDVTDTQPSPSAPPSPSKSASAGAAVGGKLGKIFSADEKNQDKLQKHGAYAGEVIGGGISAVKNFIGSKKGK